MNRPKVIILRTAGTNCDEETFHAWTLAGADPRRLHVRELIDRPGLLRECAILTIPGGFSYGDDVSAGKILGNQLLYHLGDALRDFVSAGRLVLGICNGFQALVKAGLLPGRAPDGAEGSVTLAANDSARFEDRWVHLRCSGRETPFLPRDAVLAMPIAHAEGKVVARDEAVLDQLQAAGHVALTYCDAAGQPGAYPVNPNGSEADIAGLTDETGRVLGLMPHPERHMFPTQHPQWTRRKDAAADGRLIFERAAAAAAEL